ncbi:MAG: hypothetical protein AAGH99_04205 [Planctomycetota bacterium]
MTNLLLAEGSGLGELLLENPWPLVVALLAVSAVLRTVGKRHDQPHAVKVSWLALAMSIGVYVTATLVNTDREVILERTEAFVAATSPADEAALTALIADRAVLMGPGGDVWDNLTGTFVATEVEQHDVQENAIRNIDASVNRPGYGVSTMDVSSRVGGFPMRTQWEVEWQKSPQGEWRITGLRWLSFNQQDPSPNLYR